MGIYLSIFFAALGSRLHPKSAEEEEYHKNLMIVPQSERKAADYKRDRVYGYAMILAGVATTCVLLLGWALPYNGMR